MYALIDGGGSPGGWDDGLDALLAEVPNTPAVYAIWPREGEPLLARTARLRTRLVRLLRVRDRSSRLLNLRDTARRIEYWLTGSSFESSVRLHELARAHFPDSYLKRLKLRMPPYVKIVLRNRFPRSMVTSHVGLSSAVYYGPFRSRAGAERFESEFLDFFPIRRCQEDLEPSPEHPGCMYGEMGMCLRPCQEVVGVEEYAHEVARVTEFLSTNGRSLLTTISRARDRLSEEMNFEEAARQHKRLEKVQQALALRDELALSVDRLHGAAVTRGVAPGTVLLWPFHRGFRQEPLRLEFELTGEKAVSLDRKLRDLMAGCQPRAFSTAERQEQLAILSRWYYSSWRDGEFLHWERFEQPPYRRLAGAVSRVASLRAGAR